MNFTPTARNMLIAILLVIVLAAAYNVLTRPDDRTTSERVGDAIHELPNGLDKATDELKDDRTPGQKIGDEMRHAGDKIKENSDSQ
jgi:hypothetical protein